MSLLIKNERMPKNCLECPCQHGFIFMGKEKHLCNAKSIGFYDEDLRLIGKQRPNWCPLVALPEKHGRLIDGDELFKRLNLAIALMSRTAKIFKLEEDNEALMEVKAYRDVRDGLKEFPVIIEAEGTEE